MSPEIIVQTSSSPIGSYDSGEEINREYISWLESMGIQHINAASKDYDATVLIFEKTVLSIFQHPTSRFQVFKLVGIKVLMETGGIKRLILQESMLLVGMKLRVTGITLTKRVSCYRINGKNGTIVGSI